MNKPNLNGRIYPSAAVKDAIDNYLASGKPICVHAECQMTATPLIENIVGTVENVKVTDIELTGDVRVFPGKEPLLNLSCRPAFIGTFEEDGKTAKELKLISFFFTTDPA